MSVGASAIRSEDKPLGPIPNLCHVILPPVETNLLAVQIVLLVMSTNVRTLPSPMRLGLYRPGDRNTKEHWDRGDQTGIHKGWTVSVSGSG